MNFCPAELAAKRLELLRELLPTATRIGLLVNPDNANAEDRDTRNGCSGSPPSGCRSRSCRRATAAAIDAAFATLVRATSRRARRRRRSRFSSAGASSSPTLAARHAIPAVYAVREFAEAGGLMSYGTSLTDAYRQVGVYAGRILKGDKPADLPVVQPTKFELVINLKTAKALGLDVPPTLLARADEVIE